MTNARRPRHDGWTPERQAIFLSVLRLTGCVRKSAAAAGMSRNSAFALRRRASGLRFAAAWDLALMPKPLREDDKDDKGDTLVGSAGSPKVTLLASAKMTKLMKLITPRVAPIPAWT